MSMKVTATKSIDFPKFGWGITAGDVRELPEDEKAAAAILAHSYIKVVKETKETKGK